MWRSQRFRPGWRMTLFVAFFLPLVCALGVWQLQRAEEKRAMELSYLQQLTELARAPSEAVLAQPFSRVRLQGRFGNEAFLVDNQTRDQQLGYWLIQTFHHGDWKLLVNRGFVAALPRRDELPSVTMPTETVTVTGVVWPYTGLIPLLAEEPWNSGWPKRIQRLDIAKLADTVAAYPAEIRLEESRYAPAAAPMARVLSDAMHLGYAATWFGLAMALAILFCVWGFKGVK